MKRKRHETIALDDDLVEAGTAVGGPLSLSSPARATKRLRYNNLENGFAHMSLVNPSPSYHTSSNASNDIRVQEIAAPPPLPLIDSDMASAFAYPSPGPAPEYIVEEPSAPDVKMKVSSWYEPEPDRIVITDLESFTQSDDEEEDELTVNPILLEKIRAIARDGPAARSSQALVLFRPLPQFGDVGEASHSKDDEKGQRPVEVDENAMDIEP